VDVAFRSPVRRPESGVGAALHVSLGVSVAVTSHVLLLRRISGSRQLETSGSPAAASPTDTEAGEPTRRVRRRVNTVN